MPLTLLQCMPLKGALTTTAHKLIYGGVGGQSLLVATHSSTGPKGRRTRLYEDMLEIELMSGMKVQVRCLYWSCSAGCTVASTY